MINWCDSVTGEFVGFSKWDTGEYVYFSVVDDVVTSLGVEQPSGWIRCCCDDPEV